MDSDELAVSPEEASPHFLRKHTLTYYGPVLELSLGLVGSDLCWLLPRRRATSSSSFLQPDSRAPSCTVTWAPARKTRADQGLCWSAPACRICNCSALWWGACFVRATHCQCRYLWRLFSLCRLFHLWEAPRQLCRCLSFAALLPCIFCILQKKHFHCASLFNKTF